MMNGRVGAGDSAAADICWLVILLRFLPAEGYPVFVEYCGIFNECNG